MSKVSDHSHENWNKDEQRYEDGCKSFEVVADTREHDPVNHPTHYASDAKCESCGQSIECIEVIRHLPFTRGNAIKYLWRAGKKGATVEDLKKAIWYIQDEISQLEGTPNPNVHRFNQDRWIQDRQDLADLRVEGEKSQEILKCDWSPDVPVMTPLGEFRHLCVVHSRFAYTPVDKAPERCQ